MDLGKDTTLLKKPWASKYSVVQNTFEWRRENALGIYIFATLASLWLVGYDTWSRLADKRYNEFMIGPLPNLQLPCKKRCFENEKRTEAECFSKAIGVIPFICWAFKLITEKALDFELRVFLSFSLIDVVRLLDTLE